MGLRCFGSASVKNVYQIPNDTLWDRYICRAYNVVYPLEIMFGENVKGNGMKNLIMKI